jgi:hypothetical protein
MEHVERVEEEAIALIRAYFEAHRDEIGVADLDMAAFVAVSCVEAMTHAAVLRRPEFISDPRFVEEVTDLVVRYIAGPTTKAAPARAQRVRRNERGMRA